MQMPQKKAGVIILAAAGVLMLGLGFWSINYKIKSPFFLKPIDNELLNKLLSNNAVADLTKDTDGDGLTDWEEENIYHTSPYLEDSDSDGLSDGAEVKAGTDPNCPEGKTCGASEDISMPTTGAPALPAETFIPDNFSGIPTDLTADQIRKLLKEGGMTDENLKKLDDKTLMEVYGEALKEANKGQ